MQFETICLNGHFARRQLSRDTKSEVLNEVMKSLFICKDCGKTMDIIGVQEGRTSEIHLLCPIHGIKEKEVPRSVIPMLNFVFAELDPDKSVVETFSLFSSSRPYILKEIHDKGKYYLLEVISNRQSFDRYLSKNLSDKTIKFVLRKFFYHNSCSMPAQLIDIKRGDDESELVLNCPQHGLFKKKVPSELLHVIEEINESIDESEFIDDIFRCKKCGSEIAIKDISIKKGAIRVSGVCNNHHNIRRILPVDSSPLIYSSIAKYFMICPYCGNSLILSNYKSHGKNVEVILSCPIHKHIKRKVPSILLPAIFDINNRTDHLERIARSMTCPTCRQPLNIRGIRETRNLLEVSVFCKNDHKGKRYFSKDLDDAAKKDLIKRVMTCPNCGRPLDAIEMNESDDELELKLICTVCGEFKSVVPITFKKIVKEVDKEHEELIDSSILPEPEPKPEPDLEEVETIEESPDVSSPKLSDYYPKETERVFVKQSLQLVGGKFDYKIKIFNKSPYVITNVTVSIIAYPEESLNLKGEKMRTISRIEVGGMRGLLFEFFPTQDCVEGKIVAVVSYMDYTDDLHTIELDPYVIRSVCELLRPVEKTVDEFNQIIQNLNKLGETVVVNWNARVLFTKTEALLPTKNFHIINTEERESGGDYVGVIRGYAQGKTTGKPIGIVITISGPVSGSSTKVEVEAVGEDVAMLPITLDELGESIDAWTCLYCGGNLSELDVEKLHSGRPVKCAYCGAILTLGLYLK